MEFHIDGDSQLITSVGNVLINHLTRHAYTVQISVDDESVAVLRGFSGFGTEQGLATFFGGRHLEVEF